LSTQGPTKLWAAADVFEHRLQSSLANLKPKHEKQMDVPPDRQFIGLDGYKKAIDSLDKGDVVLLTTPPAFRPIHLDYAVQKGVNVFMEKSFAVDGHAEESQGSWGPHEPALQAARRSHPACP
jgi:hypothetical protein